MIQDHRRFGILLHPTSLPGPHGIGDLGPSAHHFVDAASKMGVRLWQVLPLGPTAWGNSPYQSPSTFAGNPLLISLELLVEEGLLEQQQAPWELQADPHNVDYEAVRAYKEGRLREAFSTFRHRDGDQDPHFVSFSAAHSWWLEDYTLFMAIKAHHKGAAWYEWEEPLARRDNKTMDALRSEISEELCFARFMQWLFYRQWEALCEHAHRRDIKIMGDVPIFVALDSADVWAHPKLFRLTEEGKPVVVAGVPPDCFSETGQLWGNPVYDWQELERTGYRWWVDRIRHVLTLTDMVRLDHFRGFEAYWAVPAENETAQHGSWVPVPAHDFFKTLQEQLGELPLVAENLGFITPEVERLRERFGLPGMAILQFAFGRDATCGIYKPHNWTYDTVAYTGTHDNDTSVGWWCTVRLDDPGAPAGLKDEREYARDYLNINGEAVHWAFLRCLIQSPARLVIAPLQDVLGLGGEARMNFPGKAEGNWAWRFTWDMLTEETKTRLRRLLETYDRVPTDRPVGLEHVTHA